MTTLVERALDAVEVERRRCRAERVAFEGFVSRLETLAADARVAGAPGEPTRRLAERAANPSRRRVLAAFRQTVMAVDHFEAEYGESLAQCLRAELGADLTLALADAERCTPGLLGEVVDRGKSQIDQRAALLEFLEREAASLEESLAALEDVAARLDSQVVTASEGRPSDQDADGTEAYRAAARECQRLIADRQRTLQRGRHDGTAKADQWEILAYVYASLPVAHPVLATALRLHDRARLEQLGVRPGPVEREEV
jgi:hypothetical protein